MKLLANGSGSNGVVWAGECGATIKHHLDPWWVRSLDYWKSGASGSEGDIYVQIHAIDEYGEDTKNIRAQVSVSDNLRPNGPIITEPPAPGTEVHFTDVHMEAPFFVDPDGDDHLYTDFEIWTINGSEMVYYVSELVGTIKEFTLDGIMHACVPAALPGSPDFTTDNADEVRVKGLLNYAPGNAISGSSEQGVGGRSRSRCRAPAIRPSR